jgi:hypothetical protein
MSHDIPDLPDGWVVATNINHHVSCLYSGGDGRSIALTPAGSRDPVEQWKVIGVANYAPEPPVFAQYVDFETAIETATEVMEAVVNGNEDQIDPVKTKESAFDPNTESSDDDNETSEDADGDNKQNDNQAAISQFIR